MKTIFRHSTLVKIAVLVTFILLSLGIPLLSADTIYKISDEQETVFAKDVIITDHDMRNVRYQCLNGKIVYKVFSPALESKNESFRVAESSKKERQNIIDKWLGQGYTAEITDISGFMTLVHNLYLDFREPDGWPVQINKTEVILKRGESKRGIEFSDIQKIYFDGDNLIIMLHSGNEITGSLKPLRAVLEGKEYPGKGDILDFSIDLKQVKSIIFKIPQK